MLLSKHYSLNSHWNNLSEEKKKFLNGDWIQIEISKNIILAIVIQWQKSEIFEIVNAT